MKYYITATDGKNAHYIYNGYEFVLPYASNNSYSNYAQAAQTIFSANSDKLHHVKLFIRLSKLTQDGLVMLKQVEA